MIRLRTGRYQPISDIECGGICRHGCGMEVLVQFEPAFAGNASDAVWISDTRENRAWFETQVGRINANSALFDPGSDPLTIIWQVFDHHPDWSEIIVRGISLTPEIERSVKPDASAVEASPDGFRLVRP